VARGTPQERRLLGLWTAGWLFALLLAGLVWIGDLRVQWPVLAVPVLWALVALRPRRSAARYDDDLAGWPPPDDGPVRLPPTRQLPQLPQVPRDRRRG
jgi:hypothetical protein